MAKVSGNSGLVLYGNAKTITNATGTTTITITATHSFAVGDRVFIEGVTGMTDINGTHTVTQISSTVSFQIILSTATSQTYISGGSAWLATDITTWKLDLKTETVDVTDSGDITAGYKTFIPKGWTEGSGTFEGFFISGANLPPIGTSLIIRLEMNNENYYSGTGYIISTGLTTSVVGTDAVKVSYAFTSTGTVSLTVA